MRALLRKDVYVMDKQMRLMLILAALFSLLPNMGALGATYAMMLAFMLPVSTISFDEKCRWDKWAAMLPYTPGQIVLSKYLLAGGMLGVSCLILAASRLVWVVLDPADSGAGLGELLVMTVSMSVAMDLLGFPLLYRLGPERGRLVTAMALVVVLLGGGAVALNLGERAAAVLREVPGMVLFLGGVALLAGFLFLSFRLSVHFYTARREGKYA